MVQGVHQQQSPPGRLRHFKRVHIDGCIELNGDEAAAAAASLARGALRGADVGLGTASPSACASSRRPAHRLRARKRGSNLDANNKMKRHCDSLMQN